jgi:hypothetical protein
MSSTLNLLKSKLSFALGTTQTSLYTDAKRTDAINKSVEHVIQLYPVPQYIVDITVPFVAGKFPLPTDFVRCWKLFDPNQLTEYIMVQPNDFDIPPANSFTIKWLPERWDDGIVELAAYFLFNDARQFDAAQAKEKLSREHLSHAWQIEAMRFEDPRLNRAESVFETMPMFRNSNDNWRIV